jgi:16S rRNA (guanine(966)-N(2))-methyltransferase RsmD
MVREALFSILGDAVPGRPFVDVFAGTGVVGLEAHSRGATHVTFVERDFRLAAELERHRAAFGIRGGTTIARSDVYRWIEHWRPPAEPVTVFLSPPFADLEHRADDMLRLITLLQDKVPPASVIVLQAEEAPLLAELPERPDWDERKYGRNRLLFWVKGLPSDAA